MKRITQPRQKLLLTAAAVVLVLAVWHFHLPCVYRFLFGLPCPGCGMTRAVMAALRLDFAAAFGYHWMFWSVPVGYLYFLFDGRMLGIKWLDRALLCLIAGGFLINWLVRLSICVGF